MKPGRCGGRGAASAGMPATMAFGTSCRRLDAARGQVGMMREGPVEWQRIGIEQQFRHIEAMAMLGLPRTIGAQAVAGARR